jgi:glycosyltransferase involved in cell wall biosynthesis
VRVLIFHGYLLSGTGSNVYNAGLAQALVSAGHEVHLLAQDRHARRLPFVDAVGSWPGSTAPGAAGPLAVEVLREPVRLTVYRPPIGRLLPVYVADRYEGLDARPFPECGDAELAAYVQANVAAVREVAARCPPDGALANHLVMGPLILARGLAGVPYAVTIHGSALEYVVSPHRGRFLPAAREGLGRARAVLVGSRDVAERLWETMDDRELLARTRLSPPGVEVARFAPREPASGPLRALARRLRAEGPPPPTADSFTRDPRAAGEALARLDPSRDRIVAFVGKLIVSKGVDVLACAWPLVLARVPSARLLIVGFGAYRPALERLLAALARGDLDAVRGLANEGRAPEGGPGTPSLRYVLAFLDSLDAQARAAYCSAARGVTGSVLLSGRLEHDELAEVLPACEALAVCSTFPEAFGMVASEAAACGVLPVCAAHSGLAEVSGALAAGVPAAAAPLLSFPLDDDVVGALADRLTRWLLVPPALRLQTRAALVRVARERYTWARVARDVVAAAGGDLDALAPVASDVAAGTHHRRPSGR